MDTQQIDEKAVFNAARRITDAAARDDYLAQACGDDNPAIERIRELLRTHEQEKSFLESPALDLAATTDSRPIAEQPGTIIGPYKLSQQIGEGGMGVVFMAVQTRPLQRTVALKIIKPGMDTRQVIARFEAERQALAMMDHPNIAKVLDAGTTDSGRPYFVMDLVKGVPITKYCDEKQLSLRERLELFMPVCQAVQHAHQKGIIHRDIKPTNVIVVEYDNHAVPKVIDFGVAKATAQKLTERTMFTEFGQVVGTVEYMSPEQAKLNQLDIDTRSDIYSLGVLLYELLTGETPFEGKRLHAAAFDEMLRIIREEEPPKPSTKLSSIDTLPSVAANRHTEPARLGKDVRGELDWIVMKALEKDRSRRYETASGFAADIERHLHNEPVEAGPPSATYRFRKFARRNKVALITAAAVLTFVVVGSAVSSLLIWNAYKREVQARTAEASERQRAEGNLNLALEALDAVLLRHAEARFGSDPDPQGLDSAVMQKGLRFYEDVAARNSNDPAVRLAAAKAHSRVGVIQAQLGDVGKAEHAGRQAIAILEALPQEIAQSPECRRLLIESYRRLAFRIKYSGSGEEKEQVFRKAIALAQTLTADSPEIPEHWYLLGVSRTHFSSMLKLGKRLPEAERQIRGALSAFERISDHCDKTPAYQLERVSAFTVLNEFLSASNRYPEAEQACRQALDLIQQVQRDFPTFGWQRPRANTLRHLALAVRRLGRFDEAEAAYVEAAKLFEKLAADSPNVPQHRHYAADSYRLVGDLQAEAKRVEQAEQSYRKAIELSETLPDSFFYRSGLRGEMNLSYARLTNLLIANARHREAEEVSRRHLARSEKLVEAFGGKPEYRVELVSLHYELANLLRASGRTQDAGQSCRQALSLEQQLERDFPTFSRQPNRGHTLRLLAFDLWHLGRLDEAQAIFADAANRFEKLAAGAPDAPEHRHFQADSYRCVGDIQAAQMHVEDAEQSYRKAIALYDTLPAEFFSKVTWAEMNASYSRLADLLMTNGRQPEAEQVRRRHLAHNEKLAANFPTHPDYQLALAGFIRDSGDLDAALAKYAEIVARNPERADAWAGRGDCNLRKGDFDKAAEDFSAAIRLKPQEWWYWHERAFAYLTLGDHKNSVADHSRAIELQDNDAGQRLSRGHSYKALGELEKADEDYSRAVELNPAYWENWHARGQLYAERGQWDKAIPDLLSAIELNTTAYSPALEFLERNGQLDEVRAIMGRDIGVLETQVAAQPVVPEHRLRLAKLRAHLGQWDQAAAEFTKVIELKPNGWEAWSGRAFVHFHRQQWEPAISDFSKAIELAPQVHTNWWHRGHSYVNLSKWDKAAADFSTIVEQWPHDGEGWYLRGIAYAQLGQPNQAVSDLRQMIAKGFKVDVERMKNDSRLDPLRSHEDFGKLLEEFEPKD